MIRRVPVDALRAKVSSYGKGCLNGVETSIKSQYPGSKLTHLEMESPMQIAEELETKPSPFTAAMDEAIKAWKAMTEEERAAVGYVR
jgi:hypothetical protein